MKSTIFSLVILFTTFTSYSQIAAKKQMQQNAPSRMSMAQKTVVTPSAQEITMKSKNTGTKIIAGPPIHIVPLTLAKATLQDAFLSVTTGGGNIMLTGTNDNKDPNTHWSCGLFDGNETDVTSFHDDSNNDEYANGSKRVLKMHIDKSALFGDFESSGHIHINIAPVGHDTWFISDFTITLDFLEPKNSQKITWNNIKLDQDNRNVDLYFYYDGNNFVPRQ